MSRERASSTRRWRTDIAQFYIRYVTLRIAKKRLSYVKSLVVSIDTVDMIKETRIVLVICDVISICVIRCSKT